MKILLSILFLFFVCGCTKEEVPPDEDYTITSEQREHLEMLIERLCISTLFCNGQVEPAKYIPDLTDEERRLRRYARNRDSDLREKYQEQFNDLYVEFYNRVMAEDYENFQQQMNERYEELISEHLEFRKMEPRKYLENHTEWIFSGKRK